MVYEPRTYRRWIKDNDLVSFTIAVKETDLYIRARRNLQRKALKALLKHRAPVENYIKRHPAFLAALTPFPIQDDAPQIVKQMAEAAEKVGVGPMAAVAGAIAECVGRELLTFSPEVIVENGGDLFLKISKQRVVGVYAGMSYFTGRIALEINPEQTPLGVCTSSRTVGHSLSLGQADAVIVLSRSCALADAAATAIGNLIDGPDGISSAIEFAQHVDGLVGVAIIKDEKMGLWGEMKICAV